MGICTEEVAERVLYLSTSVRYPPAKELRSEGKRAGWVEACKGGDTVGVARAMTMCEGRGNGAYRIDEHGETCDDGELAEQYLERYGEAAFKRYMTALKLEADNNAVEGDRHD
jgi:hypothetical protein